MNSRTMFNRIAVVVVSGGLLAGCATQQQNNTAIGAGAGAAVGAGLGALIGNGKGAAIGAGIGAVAGGLVGYNWKVVKDDVQKSGASSLGIDVVEMPDGSLKVNIPSNVSFDTDKTQPSRRCCPCWIPWRARSTSTRNCAPRSSAIPTAPGRWRITRPCRSIGPRA